MLIPGYRTVLLAIVVLLGSTAVSVHSAPVKRRLPYVPMKPFEDLTPLERAGDYFDQALTAYHNGKYPEAERLFKEVVRLDPRNADAHFNLGAIAEWRGDLTGAVRAYRTALALKPQDREIARAILEVEVKDEQRSTARAKEEENRHQSELSAAGQKARAAFTAGDYREASRRLYQLARAYPKEPRIQFALGQSLRALKNFSWSAYHLKMAIYLDPGNDTYRKAIVELDEEVQRAQDKALFDTASVAALHIRPLVGGEPIEPGI